MCAHIPNYSSQMDDYKLCWALIPSSGGRRDRPIRCTQGRRRRWFRSGNRTHAPAESEKNGYKCFHAWASWMTHPPKEIAHAWSSPWIALPCEMCVCLCMRLIYSSIMGDVVELCCTLIGTCGLYTAVMSIRFCVLEDVVVPIVDVRVHNKCKQYRINRGTSTRECGAETFEQTTAIKLRAHAF